MTRTSHLVLASKSPQRRAILEALGVEFSIRPADVVEVEDGPAERVALENALAKATAVARGEGEIVLGVDTVVSLHGRLWGKPANEAEARTTLAALSGETHVVVSGIALVGGGKPVTGTASTEVRFRALDAATVAWYLASGEWRERAGGYAIQGAGAALVAQIAGDWTNVVGLPVSRLLDLYPRLIVGNNSFKSPDPPKLQG
jgi:nucleoside triphosphate pyrophosphatase